MFATVPDPKTPTRKIFVSLVLSPSDHPLASTDSSITNERVIMFQHGQSVSVRRSSLKQEDRIAKLTNLYFRNNHLSKEHALIRYDENDGFFIKDTNSTFGTVLNGSKVLVPEIEYALKNKDQVGFIMSKPSLQIKKTFKTASEESATIPIEEFGNPPIAMNFIVDINGVVLRFVPLDTAESRKNDGADKDLLTNESFVDSVDKTREIEEFRKSGTEDEDDGDDNEIQILDEETVKAIEATSIDKEDHDVKEGSLKPESSKEDHEPEKEQQEGTMIAFFSEDEDDVYPTSSINDGEAKKGSDEELAAKSKAEEDDVEDLDREYLQDSSDDAPSESDIVYDVDFQDRAPKMEVDFSDDEIYEDGEIEYDDYQGYDGEAISVSEEEELERYEDEMERYEDEMERYAEKMERFGDKMEAMETNDPDQGVDDDRLFDSDDYDSDIQVSGSDINDNYDVDEEEAEDDETLNGSVSQKPYQVEVFDISDGDLDAAEEEDEGDNEDDDDLYLYSRDNCRICCAPLCYPIDDAESEELNSDSSRKRSFDEMEEEDDEDYDIDYDSTESSCEYTQEVQEPPRKKTLTSESKWKSITKEIGKGLFYVLATLTALGVYGSTISSEEN
ncbi:hypothetical protein Cantr_08510 [Candida viswanathii]|uniref:FHA domain-containing protein n=1 Tax=Candida viswanathii TaxID=5486 RepID=A0A367Y4K8_9ASCO|nr:hypothetical protein Cantr_08510 [Candida viswanathii]